MIVFGSDLKNEEATQENTMSLKDLDLKKPLKTRNTMQMKSVCVDSPKEMIRSLDNSVSASPKDEQI